MYKSNFISLPVISPFILICFFIGLEYFFIINLLALFTILD